MYCLHIQGRSEDGSDMFFQNIGNHIQDYMASRPRRVQSTK
jgi:hypothetical protein